jgi:hypothetical protein
MRQGYYNILLADLVGDDSGRSQTGYLLLTLQEQFETNDKGSAVKVQRASRTLKRGVARDTEVELQAAEEKGRRLLKRFNADLLILGSVADVKGEKTLLLRFLPLTADTDRRYRFDEDMPASFGRELASALATQIAAHMSPAYDDSKYLADVLEPAIKKLAPLVERV